MKITFFQKSKLIREKNFWTMNQIMWATHVWNYLRARLLECEAYSFTKCTIFRLQESKIVKRHYDKNTHISKHIYCFIHFFGMQLTFFLLGLFSNVIWWDSANNALQRHRYRIITKVCHIWAVAWNFLKKWNNLCYRSSFDLKIYLKLRFDIYWFK